MTKWNLGIGIITVASATVLSAQSLANLAFEVASIKPNRSGIIRVNTLGPGRYTATLSLLMLIRQAYQVERSQIAGGPSWLNSDLFDIVAKAPDDAPPDQTPLMLRALLADRFKLTVHKEAREMPIFELVLARSDSKLGPQLRPAAVDCAGVATPGRGVVPPSRPDGGPVCGQRSGPGVIAGGGVSMSQVAALLQPAAGRVVVDRTGLTGAYDFTVQWTPADSSGPSFFTVVQEQLGLKLESAKNIAEVLVIDHVEHPTEN